MGLLDGGDDIEYQKLEELKCRNRVIEDEINLKCKKETHEHKMILLKDCMYWKDQGMGFQKIIDFFQKWSSLKIIIKY